MTKHHHPGRAGSSEDQVCACHLRADQESPEKDGEPLAGCALTDENAVSPPDHAPTEGGEDEGGGLEAQPPKAARSGRTVEIPVLLPGEFECRNCVTRLKEVLEQAKGVSGVEVQPGSEGVTIHFDPDLLTLRTLEERAAEACGHLAEQYCHEVLVLEGLDCADCARSIERAISRRPGVLYASVNFATSRLFIEFDCEETPLHDIFRDVHDLGYQIRTEEEARERRKQGRKDPFYLRNRRALTTAASFFFIIVGTALWLTSDPPHLTAIVSLAAAILLGGHTVARDAFFSLRRSRTVDMNVLMTVAVIGALAIGQWIEAALVVALFGLGQTLESWAVERTRSSIQQLMDLSPEEAFVRDGNVETITPVEQVQIGQIVAIKPGSRIPLDGVVVGGSSSVDQSAITGEPLPVAKTEGDQVFAGTINERGSLEVRVTSLARDSTLARLIAMVEEAQGTKAPSQRWVDSFARYYTPAVMSVAALTAVIPPLLLGGVWTDWIYRALALLILACPCALVISTPVTIVAAIGAAGRRGVLIKGGAHLEAAGSLAAVAFDKTGTLTEGFPHVVDIISFDGASQDEVLALAAAIERDSEHPLAGAILKEAGHRGVDYARSRDFEAVPGRGARARVDGIVYLLGNVGLFEDMDVRAGETVLAEVGQRQARGETVVLVGTEDGVLGAVSIADRLRKDGPQTVAELRQAGIQHITMLTGDNRQTAAAVAAALGVDDFHAELLPEHKVNAIQELLGRFRRVGMVGDGINDAPALASASVGIAMGTAGSDIALETADIALMADDLTKVPFTIRLSQAARSIVRQNITFALAIKVAATLLVFPGWLTLWIAVLVDAGGSLLVIANGLRLLRQGKQGGSDGTRTRDLRRDRPAF